MNYYDQWDDNDQLLGKIVQLAMEEDIDLEPTEVYVSSDPFDDVCSERDFI